MNTRHTKENVLSRYHDLPSSTQEAMDSETTMRTLKEIWEKHNFSTEQKHALSKKIGLVFLGLEDEQELEHDLVFSLDVPPSTARSIARTVRQTILPQASVDGATTPDTERGGRVPQRNVEEGGQKGGSGGSGKPGESVEKSKPTAREQGGGHSAREETRPHPFSARTMSPAPHTSVAEHRTDVFARKPKDTNVNEPPRLPLENKAREAPANLPTNEFEVDDSPLEIVNRGDGVRVPPEENRDASKIEASSAPPERPRSQKFAEAREHQRPRDVTPPERPIVPTPEYMPPQKPERDDPYRAEISPEDREFHTL